jgi:L,D-transpeptidase ErfK/SrfK
MLRWLLVGTSIVVLSVARMSAATMLPVYHSVVGEEARYVVQSGDTLIKIAHRFGTSISVAAAVNRLADPHRLRIGQQLLLSNRQIVPAKIEDGIVIDIVDRSLYWLRSGQLVGQFPVAVGRADWETPPGRFTITGHRRKPTWHVPKAIQAEMKQRGEPVKTKVPPGPDNPLGEYWLQLSAGDYGIHGTNAPWSVGKYATHGCMRLRPQDIERLYNEVPNGTPVWVIYEPIKLAELPDGRVLLEAHPDIYGRAGKLIAQFTEQVKEAGLGERVDFGRAEMVIKDAWGIPVDVTRTTAPAQGS